MRRLAPALVAFLLMAGCGQPPGADEGDDATGPVTTATAPFAFEPARAVATVANIEHEAFLAVSPDGQVLLSCAHGEFIEPAYMFASTDGGQTFRELDPGEPMLPAGDCEVAFAPDGTWAFAGKTDVGIAVATTSDQGASWIVNNLAGPAFNGLADRQWLAYVGDALLMTYQPGSQQAGPVLFTRSLDHGATWSMPVEIVAVDPAQPRVSAGDLVVAGDGATAHFVVGREVPLVAGALALFTTHDAGLTWTSQALPAGTGLAYPSVPALGPDGRLTFAYQADDLGLAAITSPDGGATWSDPVALAAGLDWPRVGTSARPDGLVDVVWMSDGTQFGTPGLALTRFDPAAGAVVNQTLVAGIGFLEYASVAHDATGRAHAVVMDAPQKTDGTTDLDGDLLYVREATVALAAS